ncbi:MAG: methionyl-tRNA formyltransferase [Nitrospiraceae bacterium]|nr:MAG: methionyl-tRNA formyltransferase [Nitrospiraceae bacterium]
MLRIVYFGTPDFAVKPFEALCSAGHEVLAAVTQPDRQSGRGRKMTPCAVKAAAEAAGIRAVQPVRVRSAEFIAGLKELRPSVIVVAAYGQILPADIIHLPPLGCVNIHASLLPKYRGAAPINWAVINGDKKTGITMMMMDEGIDTGPVFMQRETEIRPEDTAGTLSQRLSEIGAGLLGPTLQGLERGDLSPVPQAGEASYAPMLKKTDGLIHWSRPASELHNMIRGMNPWPGAYSFLNGERTRILMAMPEDGESGNPGVISTVSRDRLVVHTGRGGLSILEIQPAGKPVMNVRAYLQGRTIAAGMIFDSGDESGRAAGA